MNPITWLIIEWHWAWLLLIIFIALVFGVVVIDTDWF